MTLSARAIALQGFGVGAIVGAGVLLVAMQGFVPVREAASQVYGGGGRHLEDNELALQVARGERGSGAWWGYVKPAGPLPVADIAGPGLKVPPTVAPPEVKAAPLPLVLTPEQAAQFDALLPHARTAEEVTLLLTMVLCAPPPAPKVTITTAAPPPTDEDLALMGLLLAAASSTKH